MKTRIFFIVSAIIVTLFIFGNSLKTAEVSGNSSKVFTEAIENKIASHGKTYDTGKITFVVRKTAHLLEFALQGFLIAGCFSGEFKKRIPYVLSLGGATALIDEGLQFFSDGRSPMIQDVFLDFTGCALGLLVFFGAYKLITKRKA